MALSEMDPPQQRIAVQATAAAAFAGATFAAARGYLERAPYPPVAEAVATAAGSRNNEAAEMAAAEQELSKIKGFGASLRPQFGRTLSAIPHSRLRAVRVC